MNPACKDITSFLVMDILERASAIEARGERVIHLEIGEPDFSTAEPIVRAGQVALAAGHTRYTAARGLPALREAIAGFYRSRHRLEIDPEDPNKVLVRVRIKAEPGLGEASLDCLPSSMKRWNSFGETRMPRSMSDVGLAVRAARLP